MEGACSILESKNRTDSIGNESYGNLACLIKLQLEKLFV